jgi:hypothetical protein
VLESCAISKSSRKIFGFHVRGRVVRGLINNSCGKGRAGMVREEGVPLLDFMVRRPQYFREGFRDGDETGKPSLAADNAGKGLYGVGRVHSGSEGRSVSLH